MPDDARGWRLAEMRKRRGMTQEQVAARMGGCDEADPALGPVPEDLLELLRHRQVGKWSAGGGITTAGDIVPGSGTPARRSRPGPPARSLPGPSRPRTVPGVRPHRRGGRQRQLGADRPRWPLFASSALAGSSSNGRKASSRKGTDCPWRQRSTRCGSTPATRTSSSPTSPSPRSTIILAPGFPRARGTGRPVARAKGRDAAFVTPIVPSWLVPRPGPGSAPQACAGSPGCVSSPCSR